MYIKQTGHLNFSMNVGCCYDDYVSDKLKFFIPKNKSYLKEKDLQPKGELTEEQKCRQKMEKLQKGV